jgi:hypothetical protein
MLKKEGIFFKRFHAHLRAILLRYSILVGVVVCIEKKQKRYHLAVNNRQKHSIRMADVLEVSLDYLVGKTDMEIDSSNP